MKTQRWFLAALITLYGFSWSNGLAVERCEPWVAQMVSVQGQVEAKRSGQQQWNPVRLNETFCAGDSVRVEALSRAAVQLRNETILRLDQGTTLSFSPIEPAEPSWLDLLKGAVHLISRTPHTLKIKTPIVNAAIEGTEFVVRVEPTEATVWVFKGQVLASNEAGSLTLVSDQAAVAKAGEAPMRRLVARPRDAVQWALYYPPIIDYRAATYAAGLGAETIRDALTRYRAGDLPGAVARLDDVPTDLRDARFFTLRAGILLSVGRVDEARADIEQVLRLDPINGTAFALQAMIAVVRNETEKALKLAQKAAKLEPQAPVPRIALSYAYQANFKLERALGSVQEAVNLAPEDALAWARLAELWLSRGYLDRALDAAKKAAALEPDLARTQTVLGFARLTQIKTAEAQTAFEKAIALDSAAPLPRLGLGLAKIRQGKLAAGTREIEISASLDPDNALARSYLAKAYFEEKRIKLAGDELAIAKELDPNDPTPWFYEAILKQTENRPVEALQDVQKSIELNDNRAVYRSRLLLDEDQAARGASLARIYDDLGFEQLAVNEGTKSLSTDPANHSAHRFLSDSYATRPRHEIARVSELLQAQLLQPININPIQPRLAVTDLNILTAGGPAEAAFNEFTPLFERDRPQLVATGVVGNNDTFADEVVLSGLYKRLSYSLGQFHYESDGFRENNDLEHNIYDVFAQLALTPKINVQAEYRRRETEQGDLSLNFDPDNFATEDREKIRQDTLRVGGRFTVSPQSDVLVSLIYSNLKDEQDIIFGDFVDKFFTEDEGYQTEAQYLFRDHRFNLSAGVGAYEIDRDRRIELVPSPPFKENEKTEHKTVYIYSNVIFPKNLTWTIGLSYDSYDEKRETATLDLEEFNPKVGLQWDVTDNLRLRAAAFETVKRALVVEQTIEPTQIAGFNQFFDDINGTKTKRYGVGLDARLTGNLYAGAEFSQRDLERPDLSADPVSFEDQEEKLYSAYLYWIPYRYWAIRTEYRFEEFEDEALRRNTPRIETMSVPLTVRYFNPSGFFGELGATYVRQEVDLLDRADRRSVTDSDDFVLFDAAVGYRLPKRRGIISLEARNLLDKEFLFEDMNFQTSEPTNPRFIPDRAVFARIILNF